MDKCKYHATLIKLAAKVILKGLPCKRRQERENPSRCLSCFSMKSGHKNQPDIVVIFIFLVKFLDIQSRS